MAASEKTQLQSGVIGLIGAATLGMVFLSPAMTLYGLFGPIFLACGKLAPLSFVLALIATLPTAFSYAVLSRDHPSSGSVADWASQATGPRIGAWALWSACSPTARGRRGWFIAAFPFRCLAHGFLLMKSTTECVLYATIAGMWALTLGGDAAQLRLPRPARGAAPQKRTSSPRSCALII